MDRKKKKEIAAEGSVKAESKRAQKEKKISLNIVDIVLIILIISLVVLAVFLLAPNAEWNFSDGQNAKLEYTVEISGITKEMAAKIQVGDSVFEGENHYMIGSVTNTEMNDCMEYIYNEASGRIEAVAYVDEGNSSSVPKTLLVTITCAAEYSEGHGYTVNGYRIAVNREMSLCFPGYNGNGQCISVTVLETEAK
jgi:hypothetical protein